MKEKEKERKREARRLEEERKKKQDDFIRSTQQKNMVHEMKIMSKKEEMDEKERMRIEVMIKSFLDNFNQ